MIIVERRKKRENVPDGRVILYAAPSLRQELLLATYKMNLKRGSGSVREMIAGDLARCRELGAWRRAEDLSIVLQLFDAGRERGQRAC